MSRYKEQKRRTRERLRALSYVERRKAGEAGERQFGPHAKPYHLAQREQHLARAPTGDRRRKSDVESTADRETELREEALRLLNLKLTKAEVMQEFNRRGLELHPGRRWNRSGIDKLLRGGLS